MFGEKNKLLVIGISGVTCSGKSTLAANLHRTYPQESTVVSQDDYFLDVNDSRHTLTKQLDHINFELLTSLDMDRMLSDVQKLIETKSGLLIIEGFRIFNYRPIADLCQLRYFLTLPKEECRERRSKRSYDPPDCPGYFDRCVWPEHVEHLEEMERTVKGLRYLDNLDSNAALMSVRLDIEEDRCSRK